MTPSLFATISETTVLCFISLLAIIGNVSLFVIVNKNRNLRNINNMYILNLAASDVLVSAVSMPVTVVTIIKDRWVFGQTACVALGFFTILSFIASVMSLGMIAINRYFYIVKWNSYTKTFSKRKALLYGVAVWVVSMSLASPPLFGWAEYRFIPGKSYCFVYWPSDVFYMYFMVTVCFFGPLSAISFSFYNILTFTRESKRKIAVSRDNRTPPPSRHGPTTSDEIQNNDNPDITEQDCNKTERPQKSPEFRVTPEEARITKTFLLIVVFFVICWAPFAVTTFLDVYYPRQLPHAVDIISLLLGYLNSMCNPILYGVRNSAFRQGFLNLYSRFIPHRFRPTKVTPLENYQMNRNAP